MRLVRSSLRVRFFVGMTLVLLPFVLLGFLTLSSNEKSSRTIDEITPLEFVALKSLNSDRTKKFEEDQKRNARP